VIGFIIIWGHKWKFKAAQGGWHGNLHCPTSRGDPFVECIHCGGKFNKPDEITGPGELS
jgi:hypothetical protein